MSTIVTGIVANGVVIPASPLPEGAQVEVNVKPQPLSVPPARTPSEMLKVPREQRRAILAAGAAAAEELYRTDQDLTGFDAFTEELDDDSDEG